jgi:hypothetical protein
MEGQESVRTVPVGNLLNLNGTLQNEPLRPPNERLEAIAQQKAREIETADAEVVANGPDPRNFGILPKESEASRNRTEFRPRLQHEPLRRADDRLDVIAARKTREIEVADAAIPNVPATENLFEIGQNRVPERNLFELGQNENGPPRPLPQRQTIKLALENGGPASVKHMPLASDGTLSLQMVQQGFGSQFVLVKYPAGGIRNSFAYLGYFTFIK